MELRDLHAQTKLYERRRPSDMVELVRLEGRQYQYLYSDTGQSSLPHYITMSTTTPLSSLWVPCLRFTPSHCSMDALSIQPRSGIMYSSAELLFQQA